MCPLSAVNKDGQGDKSPLSLTPNPSHSSISISALRHLSAHCQSHKWAEARQNQQNDRCAQQRLRSARTSTQSDQSSLCTRRVAMDPNLLQADSEGRCPDLSLCWMDRPSCWSFHVPAQILIIPLMLSLNDRVCGVKLLLTLWFQCHWNIFKNFILPFWKGKKKFDCPMTKPMSSS